MSEAEDLPRRSNWPKAKKLAQKKDAKNAPSKAGAPTRLRAVAPEEPPAKVVEVTVESDKTPDKSGDKPTMKPLLMLPTNDAAILNNMVSREVVAPSGPLDPPSPTITMLKATINAISTGQDITPYKQHLEQVAANQPEKADLVMAQLNQINDERIPRLIELQDNSERVLVAASRRSDIFVNEALVAWKLANQELALILKAKQDKVAPLDGKAAVDKISLSRSNVDKGVAQKWEYTSPQGREIIRKKLWEIKRQITTTVTETTTETAQPAATAT